MLSVKTARTRGLAHSCQSCQNDSLEFRTKEHETPRGLANSCLAYQRMQLSIYGQELSKEAHFDCAVSAGEIQDFHSILLECQMHGR